MKKEILFIIPNLGSGGAEKSLINLLNEFDYDRYNVDLLLLTNGGLFKELLNDKVNLLESPENLSIFNEGVLKSVIKYIIKGNFKFAYERVMFSLKSRIIKNKGKAEQVSWKYLKNSVGVIEKKYDVAISYLEKTSNYLCVDCIKAKKKIGWIHNDYNKLKLDKKFDSRYIEKLDYLVTVSENCRKVLETEFKEQRGKIKLIHNIVSTDIINKLSLENIKGDTYKKDKINILSVGRLNYQKGFDMAIKACSNLIKNGYDVMWNVIGEGEERKELQKVVDDNELKGVFNFLGVKKNPYKYIKSCDIYVQPSRFEGKSIAIDEAKILCKPIVVTNFTTVNDQVEHNINGIITEMNSEDITRGIETLINDKSLKEKLIKNLKKLNLDNKSEILKLYELIER